MTTETLQLNSKIEQLSPEKLEQERQEIIEQAIAARSIDFCTGGRDYNFGDPIKALELADTPANID